ncbi:hypothetical protein AOQ84DRAFT_354690 [Glonium stellatum]|uniref:Uncharacterized protein n=1 Tax=Glonium stellatum TaxID=574774 RepID=A0A8E2JSS0_9PEZI|nr:hypothetical protein AOQ84DRAFT_354690 [Glonium stellatum]
MAVMENGCCSVSKHMCTSGTTSTTSTANMTSTTSTTSTTRNDQKRSARPETRSTPQHKQRTRCSRGLVWSQQPSPTSDPIAPADPAGQAARAGPWH